MQSPMSHHLSDCQSDGGQIIGRPAACNIMQPTRIVQSVLTRRMCLGVVRWLAIVNGKAEVPLFGQLCQQDIVCIAVHVEAVQQVKHRVVLIHTYITP